MNKKFFIAGLTVLLGASLFLTGCPTEAETETKTVTNTVWDVIHVDKVITTATDLDDTVWDDGSKVVELNVAATLTAALTVPKGKALVLRKALTLAAATPALTINGVVYVEEGGTLTAALSTKTVIVSDTGTLNVGKGTLSVDTKESVHNGADGDANKTVLGTRQAVINGGTLEYTGSALTEAAALPWITTYVSKGTLNLTTGITGSTPQGIITAVTDKVNADKRLVITALAEEATATSLSIPAGLLLTAKSGDDLDAITGITVAEGGSFTAAAGTGASAGVYVRADGDLSLTGVKLSSTAGGANKQPSVGAKGTLTLVGTTAFATEADKLSVVDGSTVNGITFPGDTNVTAVAAAALTIEDLTVASTFSIPASTTITVVAGKTLTVNGILAFADDSAKLIIEPAGTITAAATGKFHANATTTTGADVKLTVAASDTLGTATGFTSNNATAPAPVTLTTGSAASGTGTAYVIGNASLAVNNITSAVHSDAGETSTAAGAAAAGSITAGTGSAVILIGKS